MCCPPLGAQRQVIRLAPWLGKAVTDQTWQEREEGRGGEDQGRGGKRLGCDHLHLPRAGPPVQLSLDLLLGLKGAGAKGCFLSLRHGNPKQKPRLGLNHKNLRKTENPCVP